MFNKIVNKTTCTWSCNGANYDSDIESNSAASTPIFILKRWNLYPVTEMLTQVIRRFLVTGRNFGVSDIKIDVVPQSTHNSIK